MSFNAKDMTQGGQIASMRIRMFSQIANIMLYCLFIFFWILVGLVLWVKISWQTFVNGCIYWWCTTLEGMRDLIKSQPVYEIQYYGKTFRMNAAQVLHDKYMIWCGERKRLVRTVLIFTESSDQLSRATDRVPGLPASPGYVQ